MKLRQQENIVHRYLITGKALSKAPRLVRQCLKAMERKEQAKKHKTPREQYNLVLQVRDELMDKGERYKKNAEIRHRLASYIEKEILPHTDNEKVIAAPDKLREARQTFTWGTHDNGDVAIVWDDKSGLLRLDPDEAREESQRYAERYVPALVDAAKRGCGLHYLVMTMPNVKPGDLLEAKKGMFRKYVNFKRIQRDLNKAFPEIIGDLAVMEDPLAADGRWNVHLNVILITQKKFHLGLYEKIRREWAFNVEIRPLRGDIGELTRTFNELIKYSARAVPEKSQAKAANSAAPAITEWPVARFLEWFDAQQRFRRSRNYGCLFGKDENGNPRVPKPQPRSLDDVIWHGVGFCRPDHFFAQVPLIDLTPGDKSTSQVNDRLATGPP